MAYQLQGKHLIAGDWVAGDTTFTSNPSHGGALEYSMGTPEIVGRACEAAEEAFWSFACTSSEHRATLLETIAGEMDARGPAITAIGTSETGLPKARLEGERARTTGQLLLFAEHIRKGGYLDRRHDIALPNRQPIPRPELRMVQRPIGPVAVFGASNFPLAFSVAGGDTASALAAGCPVVVKGHEAHPGTGEIVADAIRAAVAECGLHPGVFSLVQGGKRDVGKALAQHALIRAVGFTGSLAGGRALFDLCAQRSEPIPFFGELGSVNPLFILPIALKTRGAEIGNGWAGSLTMGAGQFCTNPGIAMVINGEGADEFIEATRAALAEAEPQTMLTDSIASAYRSGCERIKKSTGVSELLTGFCEQRNASPYLYETDAETWLQNEELGDEVFGSLGLIVRVSDMKQMTQIARSLRGQLTCTLHMDNGDESDGISLIPILERKAGRLLANGFPTGVEVADAMVHGGPYPASTNFGHTSVGTLAIRRWLRPVCYQNMPIGLLPEVLKE